MTNEKNWPKVAVVGAGAVGGYFGGLLLRSGVPVTMIGRPSFVEAVQKTGLRLDTMQFQETLHPAVSTEISATAGADYGLFCVKTTDTASVSKELSKNISPSTVVLSLQTAVNNASETRQASPLDPIPTAPPLPPPSP